MTEQTTYICENCQTEFDITLPHCPICGESNRTFIHIPDDDAEVDALLAETVARRPWWRSRLGCGSLLLMILLILGSVGLGVYDGLKERSVRREAQIEQIYTQAVKYAENNQTELAIAGLNQVLALQPDYTQARDLLSTLKTVPTPTPLPPSEPIRNVAADLLEQANSLAVQGDWQQVIELLHQLRDVAPTFQPASVSAALYNANYELGVRFETDGDLQSALHLFDAALEERPNDPSVTAEWEKVSLYLSLDSTDPTDFENTLVVLNRLYAIDPNFADVSDRLFNTYQNYGETLAAADEWCLAKARYQSAQELQDSTDLQALVNNADFRCRNSLQAKLATPAPQSVTEASSTTAITGAITVTEAITGSITNAGAGTLYFARFNSTEQLWEIIGHNLSTGVEHVMLSNGTQPSVKNNVLLYHSLATNSEGLHNFNLATGADIRVSTFAEDVSPQWGASDTEFVFASQREGDRHWRVYTAFSDGKSDAQSRFEGRTPALSPISDTIFYQGTDPQGNNPGIYQVSLAGGSPIRLTQDDSDRSPAIATSGSVAFMTARKGNWDIFMWDAASETILPLVATSANEGLPQFSPDGSQLAFVSDVGGSWGIYVLTLGGDSHTPQKISDWGTEHPDWLQQQLSWRN